jgi:hypothetical protein
LQNNTFPHDYTIIAAAGVQAGIGGTAAGSVTLILLIPQSLYSYYTYLNEHEARQFEKPFSGLRRPTVLSILFRKALIYSIENKSVLL